MILQCKLYVGQEDANINFKTDRQLKNLAQKNNSEVCH